MQAARYFFALIATLVVFAVYDKLARALGSSSPIMINRPIPLKLGA